MPLPRPCREAEAHSPRSCRSLATAQHSAANPFHCHGGSAAGGVPSELEQVNEVLWRHGHEAAVGVGGGAGVPRVLWEEAEASPRSTRAPSQRRVEYPDPRDKDTQPRGTVSRGRWPKLEGWTGGSLPPWPGPMPPFLRCSSAPLLAPEHPLQRQGAPQEHALSQRPGSYLTGKMTKETGVL